MSEEVRAPISRRPSRMESLHLNQVSEDQSGDLAQEIIPATPIVTTTISESPREAAPGVDNFPNAIPRRNPHEDTWGPMPSVTPKRRSSSVRTEGREEKPKISRRAQPVFRDDNYMVRYPADGYGTEMGPEARVWRTYLEESEIADKDYISDNNGTLDGILVFASIFSAIVTTFVTQTYQSLQKDPQVTSSDLLVELISVQRMVASGLSADNVTATNINAPFKPNASDVWINFLWFTSLTLSLLTAFLGVLAKQWLYQYISPTSGSPRTRALIRQARNLGLQEWYVPALISILPVIVHVALALFFVGLIILLYPMVCSLSYSIAITVGSVYMAYFISNILPIVYPLCPYRTGLTPKIYKIYNAVFSIRLAWSVSPDKLPFNPMAEKTKRNWGWIWRANWPSFRRAGKATLWRDIESAASVNTRGFMEAKAISWLHSSSYNPSAVHIALQALAGLQASHERFRDGWDGDITLVERHLAQESESPSSEADTSEKVREQELHFRAFTHLHFLSSLNPLPNIDIPDPLRRLRDDSLWERSVSHRRLESMMLVWGINVIGAYQRAELFLLDIFPQTGILSNEQLPTGTWVIIFRKARQDIMDPQSNVPFDLTSVVTLLEILNGGKYFQNVYKQQIPEEMGPTTIFRPNVAMSQAMLKCIRPPPREDETHSFLEPLDGIPRELLGLLLWLGSRGSTWSGEELKATSIVQDCLLESSLNPEDFTISLIWSSEAKKAADQAFLLFVKTDRFLECVSGTSALAQQISRKTLTFMEIIILPETDIPWASSLELDINKIFDIYLQKIHDFEGYMTTRPNFYTSGTHTYLLAMDSRWMRGGLELLCSSFDQIDQSTYDTVVDTDVIPKLYDAWLEEYKRVVFGLETTAPTFIKHYLASIPWAQESRRQHLQYIHDPQNLFNLCRILLQDQNRSGESHRRDFTSGGPVEDQQSVPSDQDNQLSTLRFLLHLDPLHFLLQWGHCINRLREWFTSLCQELESTSGTPKPPSMPVVPSTTILTSMAHEPPSDPVPDPRKEAQLTEICTTITRMQMTLGIEDDKLEDSMWKERHAAYLTDEHVMLLLSANGREVPEMQTPEQKQSGWSGSLGLRKILHIDREIPSYEVELSEVV